MQIKKNGQTQTATGYRIMSLCLHQVVISMIATDLES